MLLSVRVRSAIMVEHTDPLLLHIQLIRGSEWAFSPTEDVLDLVRIAEWWQVLEEGGP